MKKSFIHLLTLSVGLFLFAGTAQQAAADVIVVPHVGNVQVMYDAAGIPIWGYGTKGRAIYAYSPEGLPVYSFERIYSGCYVPTWDFRPSYQGPRWPRGIHRKGHDNFRPRPGVYGPGGKHNTPGAQKPAPAPKPNAHKPDQGGSRPGAHQPEPGGKKPAPGGQGGGKPGHGSRH